MASVLAIRIFELLCVGLWLASLAWVWRMKHPVASGVFFGASTLVVFDWIFATNWFFRIDYDPRFIPLISIGGVSEPAALVFNYALYAGVPSLLLVANQARLDRALGAWQYAAVFFIGAVLDAVFEFVPSLLHFWTYYQAPQFLVLGVPWSNWWFSGMLITACYGAARVAFRWSDLPGSGGGVAVQGEAKWRGFATGTAAIWSAFYLSLSLQLVWYGVAQPWIPGPKPF